MCLKLLHCGKGSGTRLHLGSSVACFLEAVLSTVSQLCFALSKPSSSCLPDHSGLEKWNSRLLGGRIS